MKEQPIKSKPNIEELHVFADGSRPFHFFDTKTDVSPDLEVGKPYMLKIGGFLICNMGELECIVGTSHYVLKRGDMVIALPNTLIQFIRIDEGFDGYAITVNTDILQSINIAPFISMYSYVKSNAFIHLPEGKMSEILGLCKLLQRKSEDTEHLFHDIIVRSLAMVVFCEIGTVINTETDMRFRSKSRQDSMMQEFLTLLSSDYTKSREVNYYAEKMCITPKYLTIVVRRVSGHSAAYWIAQVVVMNAKMLLMGSQLTIQQIADALNFPNPSFFGQYFKRYTGMTPKMYRRRSLAEK